MPRSLKDLQKTIDNDKHDSEGIQYPNTVTWAIKDIYGEEGEDSKGVKRDWVYVIYHVIKDGKAGAEQKHRLLFGTTEANLVIQNAKLRKKHEVTFDLVATKKKEEYPRIVKIKVLT